MKARYEDIRALTDKVPEWWDENGVPRYAPFRPNLLPCIYAREVVLMEIACKNCGDRFRVEMHSEPLSNESLADAIEASKDSEPYESTIHYGDPPAHGCAGDTMNCSDLKVLEYWRRQAGEWVRDAAFEVELEKSPH